MKSTGIYGMNSIGVPTGDSYTKEETYSKKELDNLITTPNQKYESVDAYASLPDEGEADTIYRVASWDGEEEEVNPAKYSEYAWDGSGYVLLSVKSSVGDGVFDISANNLTEGQPTQYADLAAALGTNGANVPVGVRAGGMQVRFIGSSTGKYEQWRYMGTDVATAATFTNLDNWRNVEIDVSQLEQEVFRKISISNNIEVSLSGSWTPTLFAEKIPAGSEITGISGIRNFYCVDENNVFFYPLITANSQFPIVLEKDAYGATSSIASSGTISYNTFEKISVIGGIEQSIEEIDHDIENIKNKVDSIEPKTSISVEGAAAYAEVKFDEVIPAGSIISYFTQTATGTFYLTDKDGNFDVSLINSELKKLLPYKTTKDYRGIKTSSAFGVTFGFMGEVRIDTARPQVFIDENDTEFTILYKFRYSFMQGNMDIIFKKGIYTLKEIYPFMKSALGWTWTMGLPIGNGCRYYGNDSTIISTAPTQSYSDDRNIFDTKASASSFELYDFNLAMIGGTYCIHDEAQNSKTPYYHKYENVTFNEEDSTNCMGVGTGFNTEIEILNCNFESNGSIAIHPPTINPDSDAVILHLTMMGCYVNNAVPFSINSAYVDITRDDVTVKFVNNNSDRDIPSNTTGCITTLYKWNNVIR